MKRKSDLDCIGVLKAHGFPVTYQRLAVYQVLHDSTEHLSAEEIHKKVIAHFPMISLGTIYRTR